MFFFAEGFGYSWREMLALPLSVRGFLVEEKQQLEQRKRRAQESAAARAKSQGRRRR